MDSPILKLDLKNYLNVCGLSQNREVASTSRVCYMYVLWLRSMVLKLPTTEPRCTPSGGSAW